MFRCLHKRCFTGRRYSFWSGCISSSCIHTVQWSICHPTGDFQWLSPFLVLWSWDRRFWMCSQKEDKYWGTEWAWSSCMLLSIAEQLQSKVISWHWKECPEWMALGLCSVCCGSTIKFALQWTTLGWRRDCYKAYLLMPCLLFTSGYVSFSLFTLSRGFPYLVDWMDSICCILLFQIKKMVLSDCIATLCWDSAGYGMPIKTMSWKWHRCFSLRHLLITFAIMWTTLFGNM